MKGAEMLVGNFEKNSLTAKRDQSGRAQAFLTPKETKLLKIYMIFQNSSCATPARARHIRLKILAF